jgi:hypothetical protein
MALSAPNVAPKPKLPAFRSGLSTKGSKGLQFGTAGVSEKSAGAILASATRGASAGAKKKNPFLKHVK